MLKKHHILFISILVLVAVIGVFKISKASPVYSISIGSSVATGLTLNISGTASANSFAGNDISAYGVYVTSWGDGTPASPTNLGANFVVSGSDFTSTWFGSHTYATSGTFTATVALCHQGCTGGEGASTASSTITVNNPPSGGGNTGGSGGSNSGGSSGGGSNSGGSVVNTAPVITLLGDNPMTLTEGDVFIDPGATATDAEEGDLTASITKTGVVDINVPGVYYITYKVLDSWFVADTKIRTVTILAKEIIPEPVPEIVKETEVPTDAPCLAYLNKFIIVNHKNDTGEVKKLQQFLNDKFSAKLKIDGVYGRLTVGIVKKFQEANADEILKPWSNGKGPFVGTGNVYQTTIRVVNNLMCPTLKLPLPEKLIPISKIKA